MALIKCIECKKEVSDKAMTCPNCGAPVELSQKNYSEAPVVVTFNFDNETFNGTLNLIVRLTVKAIQEIGWKIDHVDEKIGFVNFQTGMTWGSWSGVVGTISIQEVSKNIFKINGTGKQNLSGGQIVALNIGNEANKKAQKVIEKIKMLSNGGNI